VRDAPIPFFRPGTMLGRTSDGVASVQMDADPTGSPIDVQIIGVIPLVGDRVVVVFSPPHGAFIIGIQGGSANAAEAATYRRFGPWSPDQDLSSAVFVTYPSTVSYSVTPPAGATTAIVEAEITGVAVRSSFCRTEFRLVIGATTGASHTFESQGSGSNPPRYYRGFSEEAPVAGGTPITITQEARRTSGSGILRADTLSLVRHIITWL